MHTPPLGDQHIHILVKACVDLASKHGYAPSSELVQVDLPHLLLLVGMCSPGLPGLGYSTELPLLAGFLQELRVLVDGVRGQLLAGLLEPPH